MSFSNFSIGRPPTFARNFTTRISLVAYFALALGASSCTLQSAEGDGVGQAAELPDYVCEEALRGEVAPAKPIDGVQRIRYEARQNGGVTLELLGEGGAEVGQVRLELQPFLGASFGVHIHASYWEGDEEKASQTTTVQLQGQRFVGRTEHRVGGAAALLWSELSLDGALRALSLGAPSAQAGAEPLVIDGGAGYLSQLVLEEGGAPNAAAARQFIAENQLGEINDSLAFKRLIGAVEDLAWQADADLQLRRCNASLAGGLEERFQPKHQSLNQGLRQSAGCSVGLEGPSQQSLSLGAPAGGVGQQQQFSRCNSSANPFDTVLQIEGVLGAVGSGLAIAGVLAVGWPAVFAGSTAALATTLVGSSVAAFVVGNWIDALVNAGSSMIPGLNELQQIGFGEEGGNSTSRKQAGTRGDPHLLTFDGLAYDFHGAGEFILVESVDEPRFQLQVRQEPASGICSNVAFNTAFATQIGGNKLHLDSQPELALRVDGLAAKLPAQVLLFENGDSIEQLAEGKFRLTWASGDQVDIQGVGQGSRLDLDIALAPSRAGQVRGLLGDWDGDRGNDLAPRGAPALAQPVSHTALYDEFAASYRLEQAESLFYYPEGISTESFDVSGFPGEPALISSLPEADRAAAEQICRAAGIENLISLKACTLDVACTGDARFTESHTGVLPEAELVVSQPFVYSDWVSEGAGNWVVAEDGSAVVQTQNGDPTFFLSPEDYLNVRFTGSIQVETSSDDDIIGFVMGYQKPFVASGDDERDLSATLLSWKGRAQTSSGLFADEGFTLSRSSGLHAELGDTLWAHAETPEYQVLGTHYGAGLGWRPYITYQFSIIYADSVVEVERDGELIFRVTEAEAGAPFEPGRFGFYNYSQANVRYSGFSVSPLN